MLILFIIMFCIIVLMSGLYFKAHSDNVFMHTVPPINTVKNERNYYCIYDKVGKEMLFSPFYAFNNASAIRQVQELIKNPQLFPNSLHKEDCTLYYLFTLNVGNLHLKQPNEIDYFDPIQLSKCTEESLAKAYEQFKEVK